MLLWLSCAEMTIGNIGAISILYQVLASQHLHKTRSQYYPYLTGQCVKKLVKRTFSTERPKSSAIFSSINLFLKVIDFSLNCLRKKVFEALLTPKFANYDKKYVP